MKPVRMGGVMLPTKWERAAYIRMGWRWRRVNAMKRRRNGAEYRRPERLVAAMRELHPLRP